MNDNTSQPQHSIDPELQPYLVRDAIRCLAELLTNQSPGTVIEAAPLGGMMMLINQANGEIA